MDLASRRGCGFLPPAPACVPIPFIFVPGDLVGGALWCGEQMLGPAPCQRGSWQGRRPPTGRQSRRGGAQGQPRGRCPHGCLCVPTAEWQVAEATALVHTLAGWSVVQTMVVSTKTPGSKLVFGKGNLEHLTDVFTVRVRVRCAPLKKRSEGPPRSRPCS
ncbi:PREDICTED: uncharacterized protein LOC105821190 isoform X2 [Propithecus coquereli]|uniref:uncharacterized protein LOC105821190 isoform X2 n=1 Tax=Propithecus coquereli TaxID=379532 RepID=UPI00063F8FEF|nr:PREDICTED: uncharacterized protein LOC105821190 isoform X2 [Propithecus coquereli]